MLHKNSLGLEMDKILFIKIAVGVVWGLLIGFAGIPISKKLILKRSDDPGDTIVLNNKIFKVVIIGVSLVCAVCAALTADGWALLVRNLLLLLPMLSIAIVDSLIRKIPNPLLLAMIIVQGAYLAYYCIESQTTNLLISAGFGFFVGFLCCTIPSILRVPVGAGDIKYSAVIGLCIYFMNYMQAMVIMGLLAAVALVVLKATKKGGLKTLIPMGPFLSVGAVISMCFPLVENVLSKVGMF